jgi:polyisoprenoid-binding protein YceI
MAWQIDPAHTSITVSTKHMMFTTVRGTFAIAEGEIHVDPDHPEGSRISVKIDARSVNTGNEQRDGHLRSPDFLDVERYPYISFDSTAVDRQGEEGFTLRGDLTIRDETHPVELDGEFHGIVRDWRGMQRAAFSATTTIPREEWGLTWNVALEQGGWLVGKDLDVEIELAAVQEAAADAAEGEDTPNGVASRNSRS